MSSASSSPHPAPVLLALVGCLPLCWGWGCRGPPDPPPSPTVLRETLGQSPGPCLHGPPASSTPLPGGLRGAIWGTPSVLSPEIGGSCHAQPLCKSGLRGLARGPPQMETPQSLERWDMPIWRGKMGGSGGGKGDLGARTGPGLGDLSGDTWSVSLLAGLGALCKSPAAGVT